MFGKVVTISVSLLLALLLPLGALAQTADYEPEVLQDIGVDEKLDAQVPVDLAFVDESGREVTLADYIDGSKPVVLTLNYYKCPQLCTLQLNGMVDALQRVPDLVPGQEFELVTVSFNPLETPTLAKEKKQGYVKMYGTSAATEGWHFLTGKQRQITELAETVGFRYKYDEESQEYVHVAALIVLTPDGRVSRYLYGVMFEPRDIKLTLVEASQGKIGTTGDQILLFCFQYDPATGSYGPSAFKIMRAGGLLTLFFLGGLLGYWWLRERKRNTSASDGAENLPKEAT